MAETKNDDKEAGGESVSNRLLDRRDYEIREAVQRALEAAARDIEDKRIPTDSRWNYGEAMWLVMDTYNLALTQAVEVVYSHLPKAV